MLLLELTVVRKSANVMVLLLYWSVQIDCGIRWGKSRVSG